MVEKPNTTSESQPEGQPAKQTDAPEAKARQSVNGEAASETHPTAQPDMPSQMPQPKTKLAATTQPPKQSDGKQAKQFDAPKPKVQPPMTTNAPQQIKPQPSKMTQPSKSLEGQPKREQPNSVQAKPMPPKPNAKPDVQRPETETSETTAASAPAPSATSMTPLTPPEANRMPVNTRHLKMPPVETTAAPSVTGPLDQVRPWVIEFRVVGTASLVQARVGEAMLIGRADSASGFSPEVDLSSFDAFSKGVSRKHALITVKNQRLMLRDLNSTNGTRLNNGICAPGEEYRLRHGDELMLGQLKLQVSFAVVPSLTDTQRNLLPEVQKQAIKGSGKRVLIIEDDKDVGNVFRMALEYAGYKVTLVNDVTKALGVVFQGMPDAIVLDLMLPDLNGLDLVRYVRKQKTQRHVPLLVVSGGIGGYQANQAIAAGADGFLSKPVAVEELVKAVANAVATSPT